MFDLFNDPVASATLSLIVRVISAVAILFYLLPLQVSDLKRPRDSLYALRMIILIFLMLFLTLSIPSIFFNIYKMMGITIPALSNLAGVCTNLGYLSVTVWLVLVYTYKEKK